MKNKDDNGSSDKKNDRIETGEAKKSRTFELKQRLLRRAWDGDSTLAGNGADMIKLIQMRMARWTEIPEDHKERLDELRLLNLDQPRSVQMLNALAIENGEKTRFYNAPDATLH